MPKTIYPAKQCKQTLALNAGLGIQSYIQKTCLQVSGLGRRICWRRDVSVSVGYSPTYATSIFTIYGVTVQSLLIYYCAVQRTIQLQCRCRNCDNACNNSLGLIIANDDKSNSLIASLARAFLTHSKRTWLGEQPTSRRRVRTDDSNCKWRSRRKWRASGVLLVKRHWM